ncbi:DNA damage-regulated autophagy modulator protein 2-like [Ostrea edulis]|uniref:DNA damage-regulated autophagy modulator protein 2-like n=1 Tax=Ostrea edulis TaxID=37623 RepID=UPI0024AF7EA7|nr:DNA damage-regulated autophagy modulator protein 2-like [Ostrea edulis]
MMTNRTGHGYCNDRLTGKMRCCNDYRNVSGRCEHCIGAFGENCSWPCPFAFFGYKCKERCNCSSDTHWCDNISGCKIKVSVGINVWVRYLFVKEIFQKRKVKDVTYWQKVDIAGIILGFLSALGISMVANFQTVVQRGPHYVGAGLAFGLGLAYCWLQTRLSWKLRSETYGHRLVAVTQLINSTALTVFLILFSITKIIYKINEAKDLKKGLKDTKFTSLRGVYLASTISEWLVATSVLTFALTFIWDFRALVMETPRVNVNFNMIENGGTKASSQKAKEGTDDTNMNSINVRA